MFAPQANNGLRVPRILYSHASLNDIGDGRVAFQWIRSLPFRPSSSIMHSDPPTARQVRPCIGRRAKSRCIRTHCGSLKSVPTSPENLEFGKLRCLNSVSLGKQKRGFRIATAACPCRARVSLQRLRSVITERDSPNAPGASISWVSTNYGSTCVCGSFCRRDRSFRIANSLALVPLCASQRRINLCQVS